MKQTFCPARRAHACQSPARRRYCRQCLASSDIKSIAENKARRRREHGPAYRHGRLSFAAIAARCRDIVIDISAPIKWHRQSAGIE